MPSLSAAQDSNASYRPTYVPVALFAGGTSGVGQAMAEALARQLNGRAHIILIGRNATAAQRILDSFPKPKDGDVSAEGWKHEFVACDAESMRDVRRVCRELRARLTTLNFLVMTAAGPKGNSMTESDVTSEGIDDHLAMRYFSRYLYTKDLLPLFTAAESRGQPAHVMSVLGAGVGMALAQYDLGLHEARARSWKFLRGVTPNIAALKAMVRGVQYNDALVAHFASLHPSIAFTHIMPGQVITEGSGRSGLTLGWLFTPLAWLANTFRSSIAIEQDESAQYMLHALLAPDRERGMFIVDMHGDIVSAHVFQAESAARWERGGWKTGRLHGIPMKGYGGSDAGVVNLIKWTEETLEGISET